MKVTCNYCSIEFDKKQNEIRRHSKYHFCCQHHCQLYQQKNLVKTCFECKKHTATPSHLKPYRLLIKSIQTKHRKTQLDRFIVSITPEYLYNMAINQNLRCAILNVPLSFDRGMPHKISIDRIDSSIGYIPGNVQLVCLAANYMKSDYPMIDIQNFMHKLRDAKKFV